ncbi:hypothetical protein NSK_006765 [Nannochloropsis salina CCMP1776]|uniref:Selenoprotein O n=1 Tax=Nannochloropsis salina CCMP1776 TaxID=1027361 RepID=A0A4D9CSE3_9STRA|nr:hypothetical protein NSK_006765 [Nannochloropsis salina CCMP1776]|eukprot:TFJ82100.1 hypothetical protein NSK_006765 [Nannochloropsis salina CCMP1776]
MPGTTGRAPGTLLSSFQTFLLAAALLLACPQPAASRSSRRLPKTAPVQTLALARPFLSVASRIGAHRPSVTSFARWSAAFQYFSAHSVFPTMRSEAVRAASDSAHQAPGHSIPAASRVQPKTYTLETLPFDNLAVRSLPLDPQPENFIRAVPNSVYSRVEPEPLKNPVLVALSPDALTDLLSLDPTELKREEDLAAYLGGNKRLPGSETYAHCYAGHQFGAFSGQLGDGAAISLGEVVGEGRERCEIQLKGAGPTPYSRRKAEALGDPEALYCLADMHLHGEGGGEGGKEGGEGVAKDERKAKMYLERAGREGGHPQALTMLGSLAYREGRFKEAVGWYQEGGRPGARRPGAIWQPCTCWERGWRRMRRQRGIS